MEIQEPTRRRRHHPEKFKQAVIETSCEPGASVAGIALVIGKNANLVRRRSRDRGIGLKLPANFRRSKHRGCCHLNDSGTSEAVGGSFHTNRQLPTFA
jgi:hypothetical protein